MFPCNLHVSWVRLFIYCYTSWVELFKIRRIMIRISESEILAQSNKVTKVKLSQCLMKGNLIQGLVSNKNFKVGRVFSMVIRSITDRPNSAWGSIETMTIGKRTPLDWQWSRLKQIHWSDLKIIETEKVQSKLENLNELLVQRIRL